MILKAFRAAPQAFALHPRKVVLGDAMSRQCIRKAAYGGIRLADEQQAGGIPIQTVYDEDPVLSARTLYIFIQNSISSTFFLPLRVNGQEALHLFYHNNICIFIYNFQQSVMKFLLSFFLADLYFHSGLQRKVELSCDNVIH